MKHTSSQANIAENPPYTVKNARKSTRLGLSISRVLVEQIGSSITAELKDEKLTVCIVLPK